MIELAFSDGAAGALKHAQALTRSGKSGRGRVLRRFGAAKPCPLTLVLDVGDLSGGLSGRLAALEALYGRYDGVVHELENSNARTLERVARAAKSGEGVRMWAVACSPSELCGVYYICDMLRDADAPLYLAAPPAERAVGRALADRYALGEASEGELMSLSSRVRRLSAARKAAYGTIWRALKDENAPLRAYVNGRVIGVPEDFYDFALLESMPEGEFVAAFAIGRALGKLPGVSDAWLYLRFMALLKSNIIEEISPPGEDHPYSGRYRLSAPRTARR